MGDGHEGGWNDVVLSWQVVLSAWYVPAALGAQVSFSQSPRGT